MAGYLGASPVPQSIQKKESFTATASQTTFNTTGYTDGNFINVYLNGVRLINGTDYTATNGSDIVLTSAASASDVLDFETFSEFQLIDQEFGNSVIVKNGTHEDTDGGRESTLIFKGEQSGGEISTLAEIEASHDGTADDEKGDLIFRTNDGSDGSSPTEAARIDSDQNLLVGLSAVQSTGTAVGFQVAAGTTGSTADGSPAGIFARKTSDGDVVTFRKDTTTVGNIGTYNGDFYFGQGAAGIIANGGTPNILPYSVTSGGYSDNAIDLGQSNIRFKDLYLSGGVYLGGTGAANKLDDYEEGTFTPTLTSTGTAPTVTYTSANTGGIYIKIGAIVHYTYEVRTSSVSGGSGNIVIGGLPYARASTTPDGDRSSVDVYNFTFPTGASYIVNNVPKGGTSMNILGIVSGGAHIDAPLSSWGASGLCLVRATGWYYAG